MNARAKFRYEPEELLEMPEGDRDELIDGIPREKIMGAQSDEVSGLLLTALNVFIRPKKLGRAYPSQTGYQCFPNDPKLVRIPVTSFIAAGRLEGDRSPEGYIKIAPDLAVEVVSPNDEYEEVETKVAQYRSAGVKLIWVVSPKSKTVIVRRLDGTCAEVGAAGELSGEDVLPGFTVAVADLFV
jgi:Uma2 family endonuclease